MKNPTTHPVKLAQIERIRQSLWQQKGLPDISTNELIDYLDHTSNAVDYRSSSTADVSVLIYSDNENGPWRVISNETLYQKASSGEVGLCNWNKSRENNSSLSTFLPSSFITRIDVNVHRSFCSMPCALLSGGRQIIYIKINIRIYLQKEEEKNF